jgi:hypothetical protein
MHSPEPETWQNFNNMMFSSIFAIPSVMTIGIGALIGAVLGLRFKVFILIPAIILAAIGVAAVELARGDQAGSVPLTIILAATALQVSYLVGIIARATVKGKNMALDIQAHMEVVGSDGQHVGIVDHAESADQIVLTGDDPKAGGKPHLISVDWVDFVDRKVHLNKPSRKAVSEWQIAA